ncbi:MAG: YdcH family protein [Propylenella sp.]
MSVESHLAELERRHEALKREIQEAQSHPGFDDIEVAALKRRKLHIKDEIAKLRSEETKH